MISYVSGEVAAIDGNTVVVDVSGIGISVVCTSSALATAKLGGSWKVPTELIIREDHWLILGFSSNEERSWFRNLNSVSGVGPKSALVILSVLSTDALVTAIISGDENALMAVPGVGKKSASRIILELKDKAKLESAPASGNQDVIAALVGLGWPEKLSREVVADISDPNLDTATLLRNALARLAKK